MSNQDDPQISLPAGTTIVYPFDKDARALQVIRSTQTSVIALIYPTNEEIVLTKAEIKADVMSGACRIAYYSTSLTDELVEKCKVSVVTLEQDLSERQRKKVRSIKAAFDELFEKVGPSRRLTRAHMQALSDELKRADPLHRGYSVSSLYRKMKRYIEARGHIGALFPKFKRGVVSSKFDAAVIDIFSETIKYYLQRTRPSLDETYSVFAKAIEKKNETREPDDRLKTPSLSTFRRWTKQLDPLRVLTERYGDAYAREQRGVAGSGEVATRPMQIVQFDHTPIDLALISEMLGIPCTRAWLTVMIDVFSRCIVGFYITFDPPSFQSVMRCLENAILPKDYVTTRYPTIKHRWRCFGLIERLVVDNGPEFHSDDLERACSLLNIRVEYNPVHSPHLKGIVERVQKTINDMLQNMPGKRFGRAIDEPFYDADLGAFATIEELTYVIHRYIIDVYHQRPHEGTKDIPDHHFVAGTKKYPVLLPPGKDELKSILGRRAERVLQPDGIDFEGEHYFCPEIGEVRNHPSYVPGSKVMFYYDFEDASSIRLPHPNGHEITVPGAHAWFTKGMSFSQLRLLRRHAKRKLNLKADWEGIEAAREDIRRTLGFYDKKKRRMTRLQTRMQNAVAPQGLPVDFAPKPAPVRRPRKSQEAPGAYDHRQDKSWNDLGG